MRRFTLMAVTAGLALSACTTAATTAKGPGPQPTSSATTTASPTPKSTPATHKSTKPKPKPSSTANPAPRSCGPAEGGAEGKFAQLVDVRVGAHDGYDRVVFEFAPSDDFRTFGLPAYSVKAATPPITQDGSGQPVSVQGSSFATVIMQGASGWDATNGEPTYDGPKDFTPGYDALEEATQTGDFEAVLSWAFGLNQGSCWTVTELQDPVRLVIDFQH